MFHVAVKILLFGIVLIIIVLNAKAQLLHKPVVLELVLILFLSKIALVSVLESKLIINPQL